VLGWGLLKQTAPRRGKARDDVFVADLITASFVFNNLVAFFPNRIIVLCFHQPSGFGERFLLKFPFVFIHIVTLGRINTLDRIQANCHPRCMTDQNGNHRAKSHHPSISNLSHLSSK
jgi:hypothetical protein